MEKQQDIKIIEKSSLENGLDLIIASTFKHTAGDRYQVTFEAEIEIEIKEDYFGSGVLNSLDVNRVKSLLGDNTVFKYSKVRNFIAGDEKEIVFEAMKKQFMDSTFAYISSDLFPLSLIKRNFFIAAKEEELRLKREAYFKNE